MSDTSKHVIEAISTNPKVSIAVVGFFTSNAWLDYGEPAIKGLTAIVGFLVLCMVAVKHYRDLKKDKK